MKSPLIKSLLWLIILACAPAYAQTSTLDLGSGQKIPIHIVVEDIGKATVTFEMAAREALNLYPGRFEIRDDVWLIFYISGTAPKGERETQGYQIQIFEHTSLPVSHNGVKKPYHGEFVFASGGGSVQGDLAFKAQSFKQTAYEVLKSFLQNIDN